jgi:hypothetical protein
VKLGPILAAAILPCAAWAALAHIDRQPILPFVQADYQRCVTVKTGPIQRPDGYTTNPYGRKKDIA